MLGKCLKHEWMETWFIGFACCAALLLISVLAFFLLPLMPDLADSEVGRYILPILIFTMAMMGFAAVVGTLFIGRYYYFYRYYKNLFTDQGYLMHTLPVETSDLVNSKLIVALIWQYMIAVVYVASFFLVTGGFYGIFSDDYTNYYEFLKGIGEGFEYFIADGKIVLILFAVFCLFYPIMDMLLMYLAVDIGQLAKKNRFIVSICALVGISFVKRFATNIASIISAFFSFAQFGREASSEMMEKHYSTMVAVLLVFEIVAIVGTYVLNMYMVKNKLNLE